MNWGRKTFLSLLFLSIFLPSLPVFASTGSANPVDLRTLVIRTDSPGVHIPVPPTKAFLESRTMVFRFLGTPAFFVGIIIQSFDAKDRLLHHGLFDQGPIDEVLSLSFFHKEKRIQIVGIFSENNRKILRIRQFDTGHTVDVPLEKALYIIASRIGTKPDLVWAAR